MTTTSKFSIAAASTRRFIPAFALIELLLAVLCLSPAHGQSITNPIAQLKGHILGAATLTAAQIVAQGNSIQTDIRQVGTNDVALAAALDLVTTFDGSTNKALFTVGSTTYNGFTRDGAGDELAQTLFDLQQGILDYTYNAANLVTYYTQLNNTKFATSTYFPGAVAPPANTNQGYAVQINASVLADWGSPASYQTTATRRPTGCYLAPGSIAYVTVPAALVNKGYSIRVGAHYWDLVAKTTLKRLDRVSRVYSITSATTRIANPLGGGIYIEVPYKITNGIVTVGLTNVVRSPLFRATSFDQTTAAEWLTERTQPGPWADFESDKFMMQVPRSWIYNYTNAVNVMSDWDKAMDAVSDLMGRNRIRSKTVLYVQVDADMRGTGSAFPGYPQSNYSYNPNTAESGNKNHFMLTGPQNSDWTVLHELGHAELFTKFTGEVEAVVNLNYVAVQSQKFGVPLEKAFGRSVGGSSSATANDSINLAQAALTWIMTDSFRAGETMSQVRMQYQQRGYGKYVEVASLFGWGALSNFWHSVNVDYMNGIDYPENTDPTDSRMLRMSQAAGVDLRPLIHFWGVLPISPTTLKTSIQNAGLQPSALIYNRLKYYLTVVPTNLVQFTAHHTAVAAVVDGSVDAAWYADMLTNFTPAIGYSTISNVQKIVDLYFPTGSLSNTPVANLTTSSAALKATLGGNGGSYSVTAFWNTVNGGTNAARWTNSAYVGSWTNVNSTNLSFTASGLVPNTIYYYTFRATNTYQTLWATNVQSFATAPAYDWSGASSVNMSGTPANWGGTVPTTTNYARWNAATYVNAPSANANMTIGQLLFDAGNTGGVTFGAGAATLTLNGLAGTGLQMNSGSGAVNTGGAKFALGADQSWMNADNSLLTIGGPITNGGFLLTLDGVGATTLNGIISGSGDVAVANGTVTLKGANAYTGDTIINSGTMQLGAAGVVPDGSGKGNVTVSGTLNLNTYSETINGLSGAGTVDTVAGGTPTLTVGANDATSTFSGVIKNTAGSLALTKTGVGTMTLSGINSYSGNTTINAGRLQGVVGGSCASSTNILNAPTATCGVSVTDNTKGWTNAAFTAAAAGVLEFDFSAAAPSTTVSPLNITGLAAFTATPKIRVVINDTLSPGTYPLMTWGSTSGTVPTTANLTLSPLTANLASSLSVSGNTLNLVVVSTAIYWDNNGGTSGFGTAAGTWVSPTTGNFSQGWSTDGTGGTLPVDFTTTATNGVNFGNGATGLAAGTVTVSGSVTNGGITFASGSGAIVLSGGTINFPAVAPITVNNPSDTISSVVAGADTSLTKDGSGILILSGNNTNLVGGNAEINAGTLRLATSANALGGGSGPTIQLGDTSGSAAATLQLATAALNLANNITVRAGSSGLKTIGLSGTVATIYSGLITANDDVTFLGNQPNGSSITITNNGNTIATGKTVTFTAGASSVTDTAPWSGQGKTAYSGTGTGSVSPQGQKTYSGGATLNAFSSTGVISLRDNSTPTSGTLTSGPFGTGTLTINSTKMRPSTAATDLTIGNAITFGGNPTFPTVAGEKSLVFTGNADLGAATRTITNDVGSTVTGKYVEFAGVISGVTAGLIKAGTGVLRLSGSNTYGGATTINSGTVLVNNLSGSGTGSGAVTINSGGTLGGTGIISGVVTNKSGGTLAPGTSTIGRLTVSGDLVLNAGSTNTFEVNGSTPTNDVIVLGAAVTYGGVLNIVTNGNFTAGQTFKLFSGAGATNPGSFASLIGSPGGSNTFRFTNGVLTVLSPGPSGPARLNGSLSSNTISLSWPAGQGWRLEYQTNGLTRTNWLTWPGSIATNAVTIPVDQVAPMVFYRLAYP